MCQSGDGYQLPKQETGESKPPKRVLNGWLDSPQRWTIEIYVWSIATFIVIVLSILFPHIWLIIATVYLAVVSNYALVLTAAGARQAAEARIAASQGNLSREEIADHLIETTTLERA
jgi:hypothetical protein